MKTKLDGVEKLLDDAVATLSIGLSAITEEIGLIQSGKSVSERHDKASRIAFLTSKVGSIADSIRKVEAARGKRLDQLSKATVLAWIRALSPSDQSAFVREVMRITAKGSVLA